MAFDRRLILSAGLGAGIAAVAAGRDAYAAEPAMPSGSTRSLEPNSQRDQSAVLQFLIDNAAQRGNQLVLPAGRFRCREIRLPTGLRLLGAGPATVLEYMGGEGFLSGTNANLLLIANIALDGAFRTFDGDRADGLVSLRGCTGLTLRDIDVRRSSRHGVSLAECSGSVRGIRVSEVLETGIRSIDAKGLDISGNVVVDCANNGIQVWRSTAAEDGTIVAGNRIERVRADGGGTGQNGNGVNVFRAGSVLVQGNRITDCAYSAVRGNAASNIQMISNSCARLGEVALYAEFGFEGALISGNIVDHAATGITVTNFNEGGRLAVVQGNLVRNLVRREHEPVDKRGDGISVEADASVTGNTIEGAPNAGLCLGWGHYTRDIAATGNVIRASGVGILVSGDRDAGAVLIANNLISGSKNGAIRTMDDRGAPVGQDLATSSTGGSRISLNANVIA